MTSRYLFIFSVLTLTLESILAMKGSKIESFGKRSLLDKRIERKYIDISGALLRTTNLKQTYNGDNASKITQVLVTSNSLFSKGTVVKLIDGGPGHKHVTLEFITPRSKGIDLIVTLYGKKSLG